MTREELAEWIAAPVYSTRAKRYGAPMEDALRFVDEYAHELAERIRYEARQYGEYDAEAMELAAKLIDPEKEKA